MSTATVSPITLTDRAAAEVRAMQEVQPEHAGKPLRLYVEQGGCSGMQYGMVFDEVRDGDEQSAFGDVRVVVDAESAPFLRGTVVDFSDALMGGGFKLQNPQARSNCGCGRSFEAAAA